MKCPKCGSNKTGVKDSRKCKFKGHITRRRECPECGFRFSTNEVWIVNLKEYQTATEDIVETVRIILKKLNRLRNSGVVVGEIARPYKKKKTHERQV